MPKLLPAIPLACLALACIGGVARAQTNPADAAAAPLALRAQGEQRDLDCAGRDVIVEGNGDQYTLHGGCRSLTVRGEGVQVHAEMAPASRISIQGNGDQVDWFLHRPGPDPVTDISGQGSRIYQQHRLGSIVTPPSADRCAPISARRSSWPPASPRGTRTAPGAT